MVDETSPEIRARLDAYERASKIRPWVSLAGIRSQPVCDNSTTVLSLFKGARRSSPAINYFDGALDYASLDDLSERLAGWWHKRGVGPGDRVAIILQNTPAFVIAMLAAWKLRAIAVPLNPMYRVPELARLFDDANPSAVICHADQWDVVTQAATGRINGESLLWSQPGQLQSRNDTRVLPASQMAAGASGHSLGEVFRLEPHARSPQALSNADEVAVLLYTSGTTGLPKGAMLTHRNLVVNARIGVHHFEMSESTRIFGMAPLFHVTGLVLHMVCAFAASATLILTYRFHPAVALDSFLEHRPTFAIGAITAFIALMNQSHASPGHFASFDNICSGGAPIAPAVVDAFERRFARPIRSSYGMTELSSASHLAPLLGRTPVDPASGALSIGLPTAVEDVIVINDGGHPVGVGEQGELVVRGANVMLGYWRKPAETSQSMLGGWMHTGDVGFFDALGWFYLVDRKKDMISASGFKVWPREVEDVLYAFPGVREAAVVGKPDTYRGETVVAFLSSMQGQSLDIDALQAHCRARLAAYKCPVAFHVLADLPKTESGKITRAVLAQTLRGQ
jgi:long-chain acyl-CoA synthetase